MTPKKAGRASKQTARPLP